MPAIIDSTTATAPALAPRRPLPTVPDELLPPCEPLCELPVPCAGDVTVALATTLDALGVGVGTTPVVYARTYWISNHAWSNFGLPAPLTSHTPGHVCW